MSGGGSSSAVLTIGTALGRAKDAGAWVSCLVAGEWFHGRVLAHDGYGLVLADDEDTSVVRLEAVQAVKVTTAVASGAGALQAGS